MKLPEFTVQADGLSDVWVSWHSGERKYHFWLNKDGEQKDDVLHSRSLTTNTITNKSGHKHLDITANKWAPLVEAIMKKIAEDGLIEKARQTHIDKVETEAIQRRQAQDDKMLARFTCALHALPVPVADTLKALPTTMKLEFMNLMYKD